MPLSYRILLLAALGLGCAVAQPAGRHRHQHKHRRGLGDVNWDDQENYTGVNWATVNYGKGSLVASTTAPATTSTAASSSAQVQATTTTPASSSATPTSSAAASSTTATSNSGSSSSNGCPAFGKRDNQVADQYVGNTNNNIKLVDASCGNYNATNTFKNTSPNPMTIIVWNKSGPGGPNSGQSSAPAITFTLASGATQTVAFGPNSQVAWSRDCPRRSDDNAPSCTWGEADFGNASNQYCSGFDVSSIENAAGNNEIMSITGGGQVSSNTQNNWVSADQANQGASGVIPFNANGAHLTTEMGGVIS